jgi:signal transduction histidine kinase
LKTPSPKNEKKRIETLKSYHILDSIPEKEYDDLTLIASQICGVPISLISLIDEDRQWFKSKRGINSNESEREHAFCAHAINYPDEVFTVSDSREDDRFKDNPLVVGDPHVVFYTGVPIVTEEGLALGTLCVIDNKPRDLNSDQINALKALSNQVLQLLELRRNKIILEEKNLFLNQFAAVAAHDIKSPLNKLSMLADVLLEENTSNFSSEQIQYIHMISSSSSLLQSLVNAILSYSKDIGLIRNDFTSFNSQQCWNEVLQLLENPSNAELDFETDTSEVFGHFTLWSQMILNIVQNGIKYNHKDIVKIKCTIQSDASHYILTISDNGDGIPQESLSSIFEPFKTLVAKDRFGKKGHGLGLAMIKKWIDQLDGQILVHSEKTLGSTFIIKLPIEKD